MIVSESLTRDTGSRAHCALQLSHRTRGRHGGVSRLSVTGC